MLYFECKILGKFLDQQDQIGIEFLNYTLIGGRPIKTQIVVDPSELADGDGKSYVRCSLVALQGCAVVPSFLFRNRRREHVEEIIDGMPLDTLVYVSIVTVETPCGQYVVHVPTSETTILF